MSDREIVWQLNPVDDDVVIGYRGGNWYRVNRFKLHSAIWDGKVKDTPEDVLRYAIRESQYVDFEDIKPNFILLGVEKHGAKTK